jgi:hypothetical protein
VTRTALPRSRGLGGSCAQPRAAGSAVGASLARVVDVGSGEIGTDEVALGEGEARRGLADGTVGPAQAARTRTMPIAPRARTVVLLASR